MAPCIICPFYCIFTPILFVDISAQYMHSLIPSFKKTFESLELSCFLKLRNNTISYAPKTHGVKIGG